MASLLDKLKKLVRGANGTAPPSSPPPLTGSGSNDDFANSLVQYAGDVPTPGVAKTLEFHGNDAVASTSKQPPRKWAKNGRIDGDMGLASVPEREGQGR